jgi:glycosyltransferase involved in cell wall biosynthesis
MFAWAAHSAGVFFPSLHQGFEFLATEFLQLGIPVVSTDNSSLPENGSGRTNIIIGEDPDEAIEAISKLIRNTHSTLERQSIPSPRTWENFADDLLQFSQLVGNGSNTHRSRQLKEESILSSFIKPHGY